MKHSLLAIALLLLGLAVYYLYPMKPIPSEVKIDRLVVHKSKRKMIAYSGKTELKSYAISVGFAPEGHKEFEGDGKTPEGIYTINDRNPNSQFHLNLGVSYPNVQDRANAKTFGKSPGGDIKIHGLPNGSPDFGRFQTLNDWTHGCIAVTNQEIEELFEKVVDGAIIDIRP